MPQSASWVSRSMLPRPLLGSTGDLRAYGLDEFRRLDGVNQLPVAE